MRVEIFSDVVCPWCFIFKQRLDDVLASERGLGLEISWRAYQLYPGLPVEGVDRQAFARARGGSGGNAGRAHLIEEARGEGIELDFSRIARLPNTLAAHRLMVLAGSALGAGVQHALAEALFRAYFCAGVDVGDEAELVRIGTGVGISAALSQPYLAGEQGVDDVRADLARAAELNVSGVPAMLLADRFVLPGAQTTEVIGHFIDRARQVLAADSG